MLSLFSYTGAYVSRESLRSLIRAPEGSATDLIVFVAPQHRGSRGHIDAAIRAMAREVEERGLEATITRTERLKSEEMRSSSLDEVLGEPEHAGIRISAHDEHGSLYQSTADMLGLTLRGLLVFFVLVISVLIVDFVHMMGIERYRDIGTMRAMGFSRFLVIRVFVGEILLVALLAAGAAVAACIALVGMAGPSGIPAPVPAMEFLMGKRLVLVIELRQVLVTVATVLGFAGLASFYPAVRACSLRPADALRAE